MITRQRPWVRGLAALLAAGLGTTTPVVAAPASAADPSTAASDEVRATLVIEADALGEEGGPSMVYLLGLLEDKVLRERGVVAATSDADPRIVVVVRPLSDKAGMFDYRVDITIEWDGQASDATWGFDCEVCDDGRLLDKVSVVLHSAVTRIEEEAKASASTSGDGGSAPGEDPSVSPATATDDDPVKPGPLVWSGGAVAVLGVVAVGVGLPLGLRADRTERNADSGRLEQVQTRTPGWAAVGLGAAALVTGAALLAVGLHRWKRDKHARSKSTEANVTPWVGPQGAGVSFQAKF